MVATVARRAARAALLCLTLGLLAACAGFGPVPDEMAGGAAEPFATPTPIVGGVRVRVQNRSAQDFDRVTLRFPGKNEETVEVAPLPARATSGDFGLAETYSAAEIEVLVGGQTFRVEPLDLAYEPPITGGSYVYALDLRDDGTLLLSFEVDQAASEASVAPVIEALRAAGVAVTYEPSIQRATEWDKLWGRAAATLEFLQADGLRVLVYRFADAATAAEAAATVEPGGASLAVTEADGTVRREFLTFALSAEGEWWLWDRFLVRLDRRPPGDAPTIAGISQALGTQPLHSLPADAGPVQIRLRNFTGLDLDNVRVWFGSEEVSYGPLPAGRLSPYHATNQAYRYARIEAEADGESVSFIPIDFVGETPLAPGRYTYVVGMGDEGLNIVHLPDDAPAQDAALLGDWHWVAAQRADGSLVLPVEGDTWPTLGFTSDPYANGPGLGFGGHTGCNSLGGSYFLSPDKALLIGEFAQTAQGCPEPLATSEQFFTDHLGGISYYSVEGDWLFLFSGGDTLTFHRQPPPTAAPYPTDSDAAIAPLVQALRQGAGEITIARHDLADPVGAWHGDMPVARWDIRLFDETIEVFVFDSAPVVDTLRATPATAPARHWHHDRFLVRYAGDYTLIDTHLTDTLSGK